MVNNMKSTFFENIYSYLVDDDANSNICFNILYPTKDFALDELPISFSVKENIGVYRNLETNYINFFKTLKKRFKLQKVVLDHFDKTLEITKPIANSEIMEYYVKIGLREFSEIEGIYIPYFKTVLIFHWDLKLLVFSKDKKHSIEFIELAEKNGIYSFE